MNTKTNPVKVIRARCLDCCGGSSNDVRDCTHEKCPLYAWRFGKNPYWNKHVNDGCEPSEKVQTNPVKVIRAKCLDCCFNQSNEVALCTAENCAFHPWRFGKNPYRKPLTEEQRMAKAERLFRKRSEPKNRAGMEGETT